MTKTLKNTDYCVVLLAAGSGSRFGADLPKQWTRLGHHNQYVAEIALTRFLADPNLVHLVLVVQPQFLELAERLIQNSDKTKAKAEAEAEVRASVVLGGQSREQSTLHGLQALASRNLGDDHQGYVLIHDAARPLVQPKVIVNVLQALNEGAHAVVPALPVADTLKDASTPASVTVDRIPLRRAQTPQGFRLSTILTAHSRGLRGTDDASLIEQLGHPVVLVPGSEQLHKLTTATDKLYIEAMMHSDIAPSMITRTGLGFDVHAFMGADNQALANGDIAHRKELILGGVCIPKSQAGAVPLAGHSDADVVLHTITDAILGALADGDIGSHFPPSDPRWRGASSDQFLAYAAGPRLALRQGRIVNIDATVICERPKIGPYRDAMRAKIAEVCSVALHQVSVKASTTERLGFTGRQEGIACQAVATIEVPENAWD